MWGEAGVAEEDQLDREQAKWVMRRAASMLGPYLKTLVLAMVVVVIWTLTVLAGPYLVRYGIDEGITPGETGPLNLAVALYIVVAIISYLVYRAQVLLISRVGEQFLRDLRIRVFDHLQRLSMPFYDREKSGVIVSRMTSDVDALQELVQMGLLMFVSNGLLLLISFAILAAVSWQLLLVCVVALPFVILASIKFQRDSNKAYLTVRDRIGGTLSSLQEGISGVRVIQAFRREGVQTDRFAEHNQSLYDSHMDSVKISAWYLPVIEMAGFGTTALVTGIGGWMVVRDMESIGTVVFFVLTLSNLFEPVQQLSQLFNQIQSAGAGLKKLFEVLDTPVDVPEHKGAVDLPDRGDIVVSDVTFGYATSESPVLQGVGLTIPHGERLALVGPTGAGKSTLAKLIARLYDPTGGAITFGGIDLRHATQRSLRRRIVVVPQEGFLFNGTILENIRIARSDATDDEVHEALDAIGIRGRFEALPDGLLTEVRERGSRLSAGEKQLVSLARAALVDPALLVLDEATSSLDPGTEKLVEEALERLMVGRSVVVIAHRLTTAQRADRVGVVADGTLAEIGTHDELVAKGDRYAALFAIWSGGLTPQGQGG
jgi:ATP-binding cassette, subfamily B, bacterial